MSERSASRCNFCGHQQGAHFLTLEDLRLNLPGAWNLWRCENCGLLYLDPQPGWDELSAHYPKNYHAYLRKGSKLAGILRQFGLQKRVKSVLRGATAQRGVLLDVGCATGEFLEQFHGMSGWDVVGIEVVPEAAASARAKGLKIIEEGLADAGLEREGFDAVTLWDVLEHMADPAGALQTCFHLLKPGGVLVIKAPDPAGKEAKLFNESWVGFEAPQHLFGFPKPVLLSKLQELGFARVTTSQTGSDYAAFFVSLANWMKKRGRLKMSKVIIDLTRKPIGRLAAGILIRPFRAFGFTSSCTYFCQKAEQTRSSNEDDG